MRVEGPPQALGISIGPAMGVATCDALFVSGGTGRRWAVAVLDFIQRCLDDLQQTGRPEDVALR